MAKFESYVMILFFLKLPLYNMNTQNYDKNMIIDFFEELYEWENRYVKFAKC